MSVTEEQIAKAIHESRANATPWDQLPASAYNPQRHAARQAAKAVIDLFSPGLLVSETPVSEVTDTLIPKGLCGINGCVLTPHDRFTQHSWHIESQEGTT